MWFKEIKDHELLLKPALDVWPDLKGYFAKRKRKVDKIIFTSIHYRYILDLNRITSNAKLPKKPESLRVLVSDSDGPLAFQELSLNWKKPRVFSTRLNGSIIEDFRETIKKIKALHIDESKGEIRHLSVPTLNVEATWYLDAGGTNNFFLKKHGSEKQEFMDEAAFLLYLNKLKSRLLESQKERKGIDSEEELRRLGG